jgi:hypothetical protein
VSIVALALSAAVTAQAAPPSAPPRPRPRPQPAPLVQVPLVVRVDGEAFAHPIMSTFVLPRHTLTIEMVTPPLNHAYELDVKAGTVRKRAPARWTWLAPEKPGLYELELKDPARDQKLELRAFVMVPAGEVRKGRLNGYRLGEYPSRQPHGDSSYNPPAGFIEVTAANDETHLTPHFRLKQFVSKQASGFPKYVVLNARLLLKLEAVLAAVQEAGYQCRTLHVMSGYRTPFYNASIENVKYSQHVWGSAADVFVDDDGNDRMDDLDRDGKVSKDDAKVLFDIVDRMDREKGARFPGGLGLYGGTRAHGPFVHVDVRGRLARW